MENLDKASPRVMRTIDFDVWKAKEFWSVSEAVKLICGRNPFEKFASAPQFNCNRRVIDLIDEAHAAALAGAIKVIRNGLLPLHTLIEPISFLKWARSVQLEIPKELDELVTSADSKVRAEGLVLLREKVTAIAQTLAVVKPGISAEEVFFHPAMEKLVPRGSAELSEKMQWIETALGVTSKGQLSS